MTNPYRGLADYCFWSRSVSWPAPGLLDPCTTTDQSVGAADKVATLGSCFAQHLARHIKSQGLNYYVPEAAPDEMSPPEALARNYGTFSARYGNVYTVRQAVQLFDRAFSAFSPEIQVWEKGNGFVDAFRPQIDPDPLSSVAEVEEARSKHLACVREMFCDADWIVFTLGLTETWAAKSDGAVYPVAPGVSGGRFDQTKYRFVNFTASEVTTDLIAFIDRVLGVNKKCKFILTVSPVPLIATYEKRHVLSSTTFSKAALRVACDEVERHFGGRVVYFPSYEIITSPAAAGRYYADDLRQVTEQGVKHVMRIFSKHFIEERQEEAALEIPSTVRSDLAAFGEVVCDEEVVEQALRYSGVRTRA